MLFRSFAAQDIMTRNVATVETYTPLEDVVVLAAVFLVLVVNMFSLKSTSSIKHMAALSPARVPVLMIRVYPPGRSITFGDISVKRIFTAYLSCNEANTTRCE